MFDIDFTGGITSIPPGSSNMSTALAAADDPLKDPAAIVQLVSLHNGRMQCTSCHDRDYWSFFTHSTSTATWNGNGTDLWLRSDYMNVAGNACENCHNQNHMGWNYGY